jgi:tetratricopeptide (TPR) repeat protein
MVGVTGEPLLSLCIIAKDEAANLPRCLASARGIVDEIVVVDTGSRDETPALAERAGARVFHVAWEKDFAKARNACIVRATGRWILFLDADEELAPGWENVGALLAATESSAFRVVIENLLPDTDVARSEDAPLVRLFRNVPGHRFEGRIHEQVGPAVVRAGGRIEDATLRIVHHGYRSEVAQGTSRVERNLALLREATSKSPRDAWMHYHLGLTLKAKGDLAGAKQSLLEALKHDRKTLDLDARARTHTVIAQVELAGGRNDAAVDQGQRALALRPGDIVAAHLVAIALCGRGDVRSAVPFFVTVRRSPRCNPALASEIDRVLAYASRLAA